MEQAYKALPKDPEVEVFYALAHLATAPANTVSRQHADRAAEILLRVYKQNPEHPGAMHYLVHANDIPGRERQSLEITRKYESVAPDNPHALHMPTHIYTRLGDWDGVIRGNLRAAEAALKYPAGDKKQYVWDEFPHAIEYLVYGYLQKGQDDEAAAQLKRLRGTANLEPSFKTAFHLASTPARVALERRAWEEAAKIVPREPASLDWEKFSWPEAIARFAQGLGAAHLGKVDEAKAADKRLAELEIATRKSGEELFTRNIKILRLELQAWIAQKEKHEHDASRLMREAVELESSTPKAAVTPGPTHPRARTHGRPALRAEPTLRGARLLPALPETLSQPLQQPARGRPRRPRLQGCGRRAHLLPGVTQGRGEEHPPARPGGSPGLPGRKEVGTRPARPA